jgi:hypothetical protein
MCSGSFPSDLRCGGRRQYRIHNIKFPRKKITAQFRDGNKSKFNATLLFYVLINILFTSHVCGSTLSVDKQ